MAAQAAAQPRARHTGADELPGDRQQVIHRQKQAAPQMHHDRLLGRSQDSLQAMCSAGAIVKGLALLPLVHSLLGNTVALCQDRMLADSWLAAISARTAGVVRAFLCKEISMAWLPKWMTWTLATLAEQARAMKRG